MRETGCWIRDAELNDAPDLAALMCELGYETKRTEMERRLDLILSNPACKTFIAVMEGSVCGMIGTVTYPSYERNDPSGRILALVIASAARRRGSGTPPAGSALIPRCRFIRSMSSGARAQAATS